MKAKKRTASDLLEGVVKEHQADTITVGELKSALHERGFGFLMMLFALPLCIPLPSPPGYTTIFSIPLLFFSTQMILGMDSPWIPQWLARKQLKRTMLALIVEKSSPWLRRIEKLLHPRLFFASSSVAERIIGFLCLIFSIAIALPIPLTNWPPAVGIAILSLGLMSKDGFYIIVGNLIGIFGMVIAALVLIIGQQATMAIFDWAMK